VTNCKVGNSNQLKSEKSPLNMWCPANEGFRSDRSIQRCTPLLVATSLYSNTPSEALPDAAPPCSCPAAHCILLLVQDPPRPSYRRVWESRLSHAYPLIPPKKTPSRRVKKVVIYLFDHGGSLPSSRLASPRRASLNLSYCAPPTGLVRISAIMFSVRVCTRETSPLRILS
jgi:hypothetical protein